MGINMIPINIDNDTFRNIKRQYLKMVTSWFVNGNLKNVIKIRMGQRATYTSINNKLQSLNIHYTLGEILIADFETLQKIKNQLDSQNIVYENYEDKKGATPADKCVKGSVFQFLYDLYDLKLDKAWLVNQLGITVCPYCNRNFINNAGGNTTAQIDHFYPRCILYIIFRPKYN